MTYQQYSDHIKLCLYLGKEPQGEFKEIYDFITGMWDGIQISGGEDIIIFHKGKDFYMARDYKLMRLWCHKDRVWSFFRDRKDMITSETKDFIKCIVEQHIKCTVPNPLRDSSPDDYWENIIKTVTKNTGNS
jgi:hypothetical protein